jgi:hypothetical protein
MSVQNSTPCQKQAALFTVRSTPDFRNTNRMEPRAIQSNGTEDSHMTVLTTPIFE